MQVVTSENFQQLVETGKVDEFKAPEPEKKAEPAEAKPAAEATVKDEAPRGEDGKFTKSSDGVKTAPAGATPEIEEGDDNLPEHVRKVIGKKHRLQKEAEEFGRDQFLKRTAAEQRADTLQRELEEFKAKSRPAQTQEDKPPKPEDFATVAEYTDALTDYKVEKKFEAEKTRLAKERQAEEQAARARLFASRLAETKKQFPDFDEVMEGIKETELDRIPKDAEEYLQESDVGPRLVYHLATHPETLDRLRKLSPRRFIAELGKLEAKWEKPEPSPAASSSAAPAVSKAPAPIAPLEGKSTVEKDPAKMTFQELREYDRQQRSAQRQ